MSRMSRPGLRLFRIIPTCSGTDNGRNGKRPVRVRSVGRITNNEFYTESRVSSPQPGRATSAHSRPCPREVRNDPGASLTVGWSVASRGAPYVRSRHARARPLHAASGLARMPPIGSWCSRRPRPAGPLSSLRSGDCVGWGVGSGRRRKRGQTARPALPSPPPRERPCRRRQGGGGGEQVIAVGGVDCPPRFVVVTTVQQPPLHGNGRHRGYPDKQRERQRQPPCSSAMPPRRQQAGSYNLPRCRCRPTAWISPTD